MTKTLVSISFALDWDEDDLGILARNVEDGIREGVALALATSSATPDEIALAADLIDFYGAAITLRQPIIFGELA